MGEAARSSRWFPGALATVAAAALAVRIVYVLIERQDIEFGGDAYFYHSAANLLADGRGFISPFFVLADRELPAAEHPPLYTIYLAIPSLFGMTSVLTHLLWSCALGTATVMVVGLLGRAVAGPRVGIIAAVIAAVYPNVWAPDGALQAETMAMFTTALALLFAYRYLARPSWRRMAAVGVACGAATLSRSELILLVPFLIVPLALCSGTAGARQRLRWLAVGAATAILVIAPWVVHNVTRFRHPVFLSSQFEPLLASANCDETYYGEMTGYFSIPCAQRIVERSDISFFADQSEQARVFRPEAIEYVQGHLSRLPVVLAARLGRVVGVYAPGQMVRLDQFLDGREELVARGGQYGFYGLALVSVAGAVVVRRRRKVAVFPLLVVVGVVLLTVAATYANIRFRSPAEIVLAVLAAVAFDAGGSFLVHKIRRGRAQAPHPQLESAAGLGVEEPVDAIHNARAVP